VPGSFQDNFAPGQFRFNHACDLMASYLPQNKTPARWLARTGLIGDEIIKSMGRLPGAPKAILADGGGTRQLQMCA